MSGGRDGQRCATGRAGAVLAVGLSLAAGAVAAPPAAPPPAVPAAGYAVVVSAATAADPAWRAVVEALAGRHHATVLRYTNAVTEALAPLQALFPRHTCFVARPQEAGRDVVVAVHRLMRRLDADPYTDGFWGILTGYDAANALRLAQYGKPLTVRKVAAGTDVALDACEEGVWYCELQQGRMVRKEQGGAPRQLEGPADTTAALVETLTTYGADLFVASGHATEHDWQIGYRYRNGSFRCAGGELYGLDTKGQRLPIRSAGPRVYMPVGNCLMGHIDGTNAMALAWLNSGGVHQMLGYLQPTWYGYAGWGCLDYFVEQPGRFTFTEAFFANQHALVQRLAAYFPDLVAAEGPAKLPAGYAPGAAAQAAGLTAQDARGLLFDRDMVAFYGDPAWAARLADGARSWEQTLTVRGDEYTLEVRPARGAQSYAPVSRNGSQRGGRPIVHYLPRRIGPAQIVSGAEWRPVITDDFVLIPLPPAGGDPAPAPRLVFRAAPAP